MFTKIIITWSRSFASAGINPRMKAWEIYNYGGLRNLTKSDSIVTPSVNFPNQVLVKVEAISLNPIDLKIIEGYGSSLFRHAKKLYNRSEFPIKIGRDFSGKIVKVGGNVKHFKVGESVMGVLWPFEDGSLGDYVTCFQSQLCLKPDNLTYEQAASIPYAGLTAYSSLVEIGNLKARNGPEKKVLIIGANGGVGTIGSQICKYLGAYLAVMCNDGNQELMKSIGVDAFHGSTNAMDTRYDIILDCTGDNMQHYRELLKPGMSSSYITLRQSLLARSDQYGPLIGVPMSLSDLACNWFQNAPFTQGTQYHWAFFRASKSNLAFLASLAARGHLKPVIDSTYRFDEVPEAIARLEKGGVQGKIVVSINGLQSKETNQSEMRETK